MTALRKNRVNHAYLFSGPRGCGKTTSARILARCLNCAEGPTDTPCGKCNSCIELARGGSGSLDVIEIDAASHGGVDDARDLRERATFAPVRDRYKIFIIDEAHMVTSAGFNALLKIVEEPPEHIKFIFATTEPDKVIGTIRSRTHHYPFRLVPPEPLMAYLEQLCAAENVPVAPGVLSLVIRAGGGSVRDSLSVLDQLMAGAGSNGLDYELAVALLGYTHASLLDDVVEAVAAGDAATVFRAVDRVIQTGHDPRRFVEDLLERFRDLIIVQAMPESARAILRGMPEDQIARMQGQAKALGAAELSRAADVTNTALTEMTGATSPRLHLELLCARILLPGAEQTERGIAARIDRVERRLSYGGAVPGEPVGGGAAVPPAPAAPAVPAVPAAPAVPAVQSPTPEPVQVPAAAAAPPRPVEPAGVEPAPGNPAPVASSDTGSAAPAKSQISAPRVTTNDWPVEDKPQAPAAPAAPAAATPQAPQAPVSAPAPAAAPLAEPSAAPASAPAGGADVEVIRRAWQDILQTLSKIKRSSWALVGANAQVARFDGQTLVLSFTTEGLSSAFSRADHAENLRQAIHKTIGIDCQITATAGANGSGSSAPNPKAPASPEALAQAPAAPAAVPAAPAASAAPATPAAPAVPAVSEVDTAWGLAPAGGSPTHDAPAQASPAIPEPGAVRVPPGQPSAVSSPETPAAPAEESGHVGNPAQAGAVTSLAGQAAQPASEGPASEDYSYSDDDWAPPRDEDAPPLDEEPPMDWVPPSDSGWQSAPPEAAAPAPAADAAPATDPAPMPAGAAAASPQVAAGPDTSNDPWSRAVEQSPGSWIVGTTSNVGAHVAAVSTQTAVPELDAHNSSSGAAAYETAPAYEPAAAQAPAQAAQQASAQQPQAQQPQAQQAHAPVPAPATSWATVPAPTPAETTALTPGKQSLYQRLSNSPEAMAGRIQVPARAAAATATMVEDIPSADDETIEESGVFGRAAVERILGGRLLEERSLDGTPLMRR